MYQPNCNIDEPINLRQRRAAANQDAVQSLRVDRLGMLVQIFLAQAAITDGPAVMPLVAGRVTPLKTVAIRQAHTAAMLSSSPVKERARRQAAISKLFFEFTP